MLKKILSPEVYECRQMLICYDIYSEMHEGLDFNNYVATHSSYDGSDSINYVREIIENYRADFLEDTFEVCDKGYPQMFYTNYIESTIYEKDVKCINSDLFGKSAIEKIEDYSKIGIDMVDKHPVFPVELYIIHQMILDDYGDEVYEEAKTCLDTNPKIYQCDIIILNP